MWKWQSFDVLLQVIPEYLRKIDLKLMVQNGLGLHVWWIQVLYIRCIIIIGDSFWQKGSKSWVCNFAIVLAAGWIGVCSVFCAWGLIEVHICRFRTCFFFFSVLVLLWSLTLHRCLVRRQGDGAEPGSVFEPSSYPGWITPSEVNPAALQLR